MRVCTSPRREISAVHAPSAATSVRELLTKGGVSTCRRARSRCLGALVPCCLGALLPWCLGALVGF
ncbi:hypothetical protein DIQ79_05150 [Mycolicibacterium smegmatis]|nr:hypothetical protein EYS45_03665 [Mycolicibacterium smegmatis MC2 155]TBM46056.1 hypothetical protein DIQ86_14060 [Mycolicibacterium smegmatis]TBM54706.1 hypothetical protein DIQ85_04490 [Mycolicibacterium smegmatis]TBM66132.1 hypothetical protein DIQ83_04510 [Mycolicibacterium smegmatis]TBM74295.1 hypothetical protein DIQ82_04490 [Mycolicibacterium smegmatis]